jgi:hypothetical protein
VAEDAPKTKSRSYWPVALRLPWLLLVTAFVIALIAGLEVAARKLPTNVRHYNAFKSIAAELRRDATVTSSSGALRTSMTVPLLHGTTITTESRTSTRSRSTTTTRTGTATITGAGKGSTGVYTFTMTSPSTLTYTATLRDFMASIYSRCLTEACPDENGETAYVPEFVTTTEENVRLPSTAPTANTDDFVPPETTVDQFNKDKSASRVILRFQLWKVFVGNYLPLVLAVLLRLFWIPINANARLMQPFIAMSASSDGASARSALFSNYLVQTLNPLPLIKDGSWLTVGAGFNMVLVTLVAPLSSEAIFLDTNYNCPNADPDPSSHNPCWPPQITGDTYVIRALQALLCIIALVCVCTIWFAFRSSVSLSMDPSSIAGVASLMHHPVVLHDFRSNEPDVSTTSLRMGLGNRRYALQRYLTNDRRQKFGIVPVAGYEYSAQEDGGFSKPGTKSRLATVWKRYGSLWLSTVFIALCLAFMSVIVAYYLDRSDGAFNSFFNSNGFGPRFVMTGAATIVDIIFKSMHQGIAFHHQPRTTSVFCVITNISTDIMLTAPFRHLCQKPQNASATILLPKWSLPHFATASFLRHGYVFAGIVSAIAVLSDVLVIMAAVIPYSPGRFWIEFRVSSYLCMGTLAAIIIATMVYLYWMHGVEMPRKPDTLAGVISYVCASRLLDDVDECGERTEEALRKNGVRYMYGMFKGTDGVGRWMIDSCR